MAAMHAGSRQNFRFKNIGMAPHLWCDSLQLIVGLVPVAQFKPAFSGEKVAAICG